MSRAPPRRVGARRHGSRTWRPTARQSGDGLHDPAAREFDHLEAAALLDELRAQRAQRRGDLLGVGVDHVGQLLGGDRLEGDGQHRLELLFERNSSLIAVHPSDVESDVRVDPRIWTSPKVAPWPSSTWPSLHSSRSARKCTMISMRVVSPSVSRRKESRPIAGRRWDSVATVSATVTASTVTWWRRTTRNGLLLDPAQVRERELGGRDPRPEVGRADLEAVVDPAQARVGATGALEERHEGVGEGRVGTQFERRASKTSRSSQPTNSSSSSPLSRPGNRRWLFISSRIAADQQELREFVHRERRGRRRATSRRRRRPAGRGARRACRARGSRSTATAAPRGR